MKILNVNISLDPIHGGGTAERTFQMSRFLANAGHTCTILTTDLGLLPERVDDLAGVEIIALPCLAARFYVPWFSFSTIKRIVGNSDIIHLMNHWSFLNALVYCFARLQKKPYVICPAGSLPIYGRSKLIKIFYNLVIGTRIIRNADRCVAITPDEIARLMRFGVERIKISVIPNGVCPEEFLNKDDTAFRQAHGLPDKPFILFVGRLNSIKGPDLLLRAFCAIKDEFPHHLVFAGPDGGMLRDLKEIVRQENIIDRVHFVGYLDGTQKSFAYHAADLLVIPSRSEAMSIVVLEAGAAATPVLLTDQCGFDIKETGGGMVVPVSVEGISAGLTNLLSRSDELKTMGNKLKQYTQEFFTWRHIVGKYIRLYEEILGI